MKRILSTILAIAMVMMCMMAMPTFANESGANEVIYSGLPTGIANEGGETVDGIIFTKTDRAASNGSVVSYNAEEDVIYMQPIAQYAEAQINIAHAVNKETGGNVSYIFEFETCDDVNRMTIGVAPNWTGISRKFYTPSMGMAVNREYKLVFTYNTQTAQFTSFINGERAEISPDTFVKDAAANTALTPENGITGMGFRVLLDSPQENVKIKLTNISIIHDVPKTGYGTYFSSLGGVEGTAKVENGVIVAGQANTTTNKHVVNNGDGTWNYNLGTASDWTSSQLYASFPVNNTTSGEVYFEYNIKTAADAAPTTINTYLNDVKFQVGGVGKNKTYELLFKYNTKTGAGEFFLDGVSKNVYEFDPATGISGCKLDFIPNGTMTVTGVEVGIVKIPGTEYGTMISGVSDVEGSGNSFSKSNRDGASFTASYHTNSTNSSITKDNGTLVYADNDANQWAGEITSKLLYPASNTFEKKGFMYYEYTFSFMGVPSSIYIDIIPASVAQAATHKTCIFEAKNGKIQNNTSTGSANTDATGEKEYTLGIAYEISTGDWCIVLDGKASPGLKLNTTVEGTTIAKIDPSLGISGIQMRYFGDYSGNNSSLILKDASVKFRPYDNEQTIGEIKLDKEEGIASIDIIKNPFRSNIQDTVLFTIASYTGDRLVAVNFKEMTLLAGERTYTLELNDKNGGSEVKAFLWSDFMTPLKFK